MNRRIRKINAFRHGLRANIYVSDRVEVDITAMLQRTYGGVISIGPESRIHSYALIDTYGGHVKLGARVSLNPFSILYGHGGLTIGNDVRIASHVTVIAANHGIDDLEIPIRKQPLTCRGISIEDDVWIGSGARVLDGVVLSRGSVVAAGSVVTQSTDPLGVYGGVPARLLRLRGQKRVES